MYECKSCGATFDELLIIEDECGKLFACPNCKSDEELFTGKKLFKPSPRQIFDRLIVPIAKINEALDKPLSRVNPSQVLATVFGYLAEFSASLCGDTGGLEELLYTVKTPEDIKRCRDEFDLQMEEMVEL